jgi:hypothetical protein
MTKKKIDRYLDEDGDDDGDDDDEVEDEGERMILQSILKINCSLLLQCPQLSETQLIISLFVK